MDTAAQLQRLNEPRAGGISRRSVLGRLLATAQPSSWHITKRVAGAAAVAGAGGLGPQRASAQYVEVGLAIGSAVAGFLASRKKGDGGLGALARLQPR